MYVFIYNDECTQAQPAQLITLFHLTFTLPLPTLQLHTQTAHPPFFQTKPHTHRFETEEAGAVFVKVSPSMGAIRMFESQAESLRVIAATETLRCVCVMCVDVQMVADLGSVSVHIDSIHTGGWWRGSVYAFTSAHLPQHMQHTASPAPTSPGCWETARPRATRSTRSWPWSSCTLFPLGPASRWACGCLRVGVFGDVCVCVLRGCDACSVLGTDSLSLTAHIHRQYSHVHPHPLTHTYTHTRNSRWRPSWGTPWPGCTRPRCPSLATTTGCRHVSVCVSMCLCIHVSGSIEK